MNGEAERTGRESRNGHAADPEHNEGGAYAAALLERIGAGASNPAELASLLQFLHSGSLLHGACAVIFAALSASSRTGPTRPAP
jgi:hypothetical protein